MALGNGFMHVKYMHASMDTVERLMAEVFGYV